MRITFIAFSFCFSLSHSVTPGAIIFGSDQEVRQVMRAVRRSNATGAFSWIGSDGWSARNLVSDDYEPEASSSATSNTYTHTYTYKCIRIPVEIMSLNVRKVWLMNCALSCWCATPTAVRVGSRGWLGHDTNYKFINDCETGKISVQTKCCCMMNCAWIEINCVCYSIWGPWAWPWQN